MDKQLLEQEAERLYPKYPMGTPSIVNELAEIEQAAYIAGATSSSTVKELQKQNSEWREECERLAGLVDFWQKKYYEVVPPHQNPKIDNL